MDDIRQPKRLTVRFSIASILFLMTCVGGYLGGYRCGYLAGDSTWHYGSNYVMTYNVADLVEPTPTFDPGHIEIANFDDLVTILDSVRVDQPKGECMIRPFPTNLSLVVTGNGIVHRRIQSLLTELRKTAPHGPEEKLTKNF